MFLWSARDLNTSTRHFWADVLHHIRFHGQNRPQDTETLRDYDIVLTTYATLAADRNGQALLYRMEWFRVVLDEGQFLIKSSKNLSKNLRLITRTELGQQLIGYGTLPRNSSRRQPDSMPEGGGVLRGHRSKTNWKILHPWLDSSNFLLFCPKSPSKNTF